MNSDLPQEVLLLLAGLCIIAGFFLLSLIRIFRLSRANRRMRVESAQMARQAAQQQMEVTSIHHDAMSWRARTQRQFDALRGDLSHRLQQADQGGKHALKELTETHQKTLSAALAQITELETALATRPAAVEASPIPAAISLGKPPPPASTLATSRVQSLEAELAAALAEATLYKQQNMMLQRAVQLARRRAPAAPMRKSHPRSSLRSA